LSVYLSSCLPACLKNEALFLTGVEDIALPNSRTQIHGSVTVTSALDQLPQWFIL